MLGQRTIGHPETVEEAFPEFEGVEGGEVAAAGEESAQGEEGGFAGWAICKTKVSTCGGRVGEEGGWGGKAEGGRKYQRNQGS